MDIPALRWSRWPVFPEGWLGQTLLHFCEAITLAPPGYTENTAGTPCFWSAGAGQWHALDNSGRMYCPGTGSILQRRQTAGSLADPRIFAQGIAGQITTYPLRTECALRPYSARRAIFLPRAMVSIIWAPVPLLTASIPSPVPRRIRAIWNCSIALSPALPRRCSAATQPCNTARSRGPALAPTPDYLPVIGPVVDLRRLRLRLCGVSKDALNSPLRLRHLALRAYWSMPRHGLSRGLISWPLPGADSGAAEWRGRCPCQGSDLAVHPAAFCFRQLIRGNRAQVTSVTGIALQQSPETPGLC